MKKIILLTTVLITGIPVSCDFFEPRSYQIEELEATAGHFKIDNSRTFERINFTHIGSDTLNANELAIEIAISRTSYVADAIEFSFLPSAFADPIPHSTGTKISLISIYADESIFANGNEYEAGENLTNLFSIKSNPTDPLVPILKFIQEFEEWTSSEELFLQFKTPLDRSLAQSFKIDFTFENGKFIEMNTKKIVVK